MAEIFLVTGPMAAGKTTVARLLAQRFPRGVHVEGDVFRRSIVSGRQELEPEPSDEALAQLTLRYRLATAAADAYWYAGFTVVVEDGTPRLGVWLDTSAQTPEETVDEILRRR